MKIVARGTNWVGDAVMTIPALRELRRIFPDSHLTLSTRSWAKGIFEDADFIDEILSLDREKNALQTALRQAKIWREKRFDLAVLFPNSFESAVLAKLGRVKIRFGYATDGRSFLLSDAVPVPDWKTQRHEIFYYLNLVAELERALFGTTKVWESEPRFELGVSEARKAGARKILEQNGVDLSKKLFAFCPGSTNSRAKRWHTESFARLGDRLKCEFNAEILLTGSPDELDVSMEVAAKMQESAILLTGKTSLAEAMAILSVCDLLVSNDTGPAHIAAALGTKTLAIFGPTNPLTTKPFPANAEIIYKKVECSPCLLRECPIDHRCMTRISAEEVFERTKEIFATNTENEHG